MTAYERIVYFANPPFHHSNFWRYCRFLVLLSGRTCTCSQRTNLGDGRCDRGVYHCIWGIDCRLDGLLKVAHPVAVVLQGIGLLLLIQVTNSLIMQLTHAPLAANQSNLIKLVHTYPWGIKLLAVVGGPIVEEYLFRGLLMNSFGSLQKRSWQWVSVLVSAFAFGFAHVAGSRIDYNIFIYAALGAVLAWTYLRTRDMRYSIGLHILNNATILLV